MNSMDVQEIIDLEEGRKIVNLYSSTSTALSSLAQEEPTSYRAVINDRLRVLALHGKGSNNEITKSQLTNLGITEDKYEIVYMHGPLLDEEDNPDLVEFCHGPFYSWFHGNYNDARFKSSFLAAIALVVEKIVESGPFHILYGFSQGGTIASYSILTYSNPALRGALLEFLYEEKRSLYTPLLHSNNNNFRPNLHSGCFELLHVANKVIIFLLQYLIGLKLKAQIQIYFHNTYNITSNE